MVMTFAIKIIPEFPTIVAQYLTYLTGYLRSCICLILRAFSDVIKLFLVLSILAKYFFHSANNPPLPCFCLFDSFFFLVLSYIPFQSFSFCLSPFSLFNHISPSLLFHPFLTFPPFLFFSVSLDFLFLCLDTQPLSIYTDKN